MQRHLYILSEGERDEMFYERLAERVSGQTFTADVEFRVRPGENWKTVPATAKLLVSRFNHWQGQQDIALIIAVDNDRAPGHPAGRSYPRPLPPHDQKKNPRYQELHAMLTAAFGPDRDSWPVKVAVAMPVEMLESWVLSLLQPELTDLPPFAVANSDAARRYYGKSPPPQLKDLVYASAKERGLTLWDLVWEAAESDLESAIAGAPSLGLFQDDLAGW